MKAKTVKKKVTDEKYYDKRGILSEIVEGDVALSLEDALKRTSSRGSERENCGT